MMVKEQTNSYGIMVPMDSSEKPVQDGEASMVLSQIRGSALYSTASLINHECIPNVARCDDFDRSDPDNTSMIFKALHDLPKGTELLQSYFPLSWQYDERLEQCETVYGFQCTCSRCRVEAEDFDEVQIEDKSCLTENKDADISITEAQPAAPCCLPMDVEKVESEVDPTSEIDMTYIHLFLLKYLCPLEGCEGTLVPDLNIDSSTQVCNKCGTRRTEEDFLRELEDTDTMLDDMDEMEGDD